MSIRDLLARQPQAKRVVTPAQAHLRMCLAGGAAHLRSEESAPKWQQLGSGYFSSVYAVDECTVVKLGSSLDGGYVYAMWCLANQHLEGVPRVYAVQRCTRRYKCMSDEAYEGYIVVMERLQELRRSQWGDVIDREGKDQYRAACAAAYKDDYADEDDGIPYCWAGEAMVALRHHMNKSIHAGRSERGEFARGKVSTQYFDLHEGNVMMRGSVLVITDPIATVRDKTRGKFSRKRYEALRKSC